jgi:hypothetical protein
MAGGNARAVLGTADANESVSAAARSDDRMRCRRDTEGWPERGHPSLACEQPASGAGLTIAPTPDPAAPSPLSWPHRVSMVGRPSWLRTFHPLPSGARRRSPHAPRPVNNLTVELTDWGAHDRAAGSKDLIAARLDRLPRPFPMS